MKNTKKLLFAFSILALFSMIAGVSAFAPTLVTPATSANLVATVAWNVTNGTVTNMTSCNIWVSSPSTANSTYVNISTYTNTSSEARFINGTFNSLWLEDSNDYSILAQCTNGTVYNSTANTLITIDNTIPTAPSSLGPADISTNTSSGVYNFSSTVNNAKTTACTLYFSSAGSSTFSGTTGTYATTSCTASKTFSGSSSNGDYLYYFQASDGTNTTNSAIQTLYVRIAPNYGGVANQQQANQLVNQKQQALAVGSGESSAPIPTWVWVVGVIVIIGIVAYLIKKKR